MSNFFPANGGQNMHEKERNVLLSQSQKLMRQGYKSPYRESQQQLSKQHVTTPNRFISGNDTLPPRAVPFRRSRNTSRERTEQFREQSDQYQHIRKIKETYVESKIKLSSLEKKITAQMAEKQKWRALCLTHEQTINSMGLQLSREQQEKQKMKIQMLKMKQELLEKEQKLTKNNQTIQNLNKSLKQHKINQKSLANLKNLQNQLDLIQQKNIKLTQQNQQLSKNNGKMKVLVKKESTSESQMQVPNKSKMQSLQMQVDRLREQLKKDRSERETILEQTLRNLQKRLYDKQTQIKSMSIQLNFIDRKKYTSIDDVKTKKDQQIKDLKQKFLKVSRDLKQTKDKFQYNQKKKIPTSIRKAKSSKLLGNNSQSQEVTFELSSQH